MPCGSDANSAVENPCHANFVAHNQNMATGTLDLISVLEPLFDKDLKALRTEMGSFHDQDDIWRTVPGISNSAGNLCLHLCGNLRHYFGHVLAGEQYVRDRPHEFAAQGLPLQTLLEEVDRTMASMQLAWKSSSTDDLSRPYPVPTPIPVQNTGQILLHLYGHLGYHLGQINYLRRILGH